MSIAFISAIDQTEYFSGEALANVTPKKQKTKTHAKRIVRTQANCTRFFLYISNYDRQRNTINNALAVSLAPKNNEFQHISMPK